MIIKTGFPSRLFFVAGVGVCGDFGQCEDAGRASVHCAEDGGKDGGIFKYHKFRMRKRGLECGALELSNIQSEQMMRSVKTDLKNAGNIGSEESARHNAFMFSVI